MVVDERVFGEYFSCVNGIVEKSPGKVLGEFDDGCVAVVLLKKGFGVESVEAAVSECSMVAQGRDEPGVYARGVVDGVVRSRERVEDVRELVFKDSRRMSDFKAFDEYQQTLRGLMMEGIGPSSGVDIHICARMLDKGYCVKEVQGAIVEGSPIVVFPGSQGNYKEYVLLKAEELLVKQIADGQIANEKAREEYKRGLGTVDVGDAFRAVARRDRDSSPVKAYEYHKGEFRKGFADGIVTAEVDLEIASVLFKERFSKMQVEQGIRDGAMKGMDYAKAIVEAVPRENEIGR